MESQKNLQDVIGQVEMKQEQDYEFQKKQKEYEGKQWFETIGPASLIYAVLYTICSYKNTAGIAIPIWVGATITYVYYVMKRIEMRWKKGSTAIAVTMLLLSISTVLTGNSIIHVFNYIGFFVLLLVLLLHNFYDVGNWGIDKMLLEMIASVFGAIGRVCAPFEEGIAFVRLRDKRQMSHAYYIIIGLVVAFPLVMILGLCLGSADAVFANLFSRTIRMDIIAESIFKIPLMLLFGFFSAYCGIRFLAMKTRPEKDLEYKKHTALIAITFTSALTLMYLLFSGIQVFYLFLGYGSLPDGMTYASYARTGFFQLLFVAAVNQVLILLVKRCFEESKILKALLLTICICTFIMIASSAYRMILYIAAYHLTWLRVFVLVSLAIMAMLMVGIVLELQREKFHLFRYSLVVVSVIYVAFSFSHADYWIASYNLNHITESNQFEILDYVGTLSTDAVPVVQKYIDSTPELKYKIDYAIREEDSLEDTVYYAYEWYFTLRDNVNSHRKMSIRTFNLSYYIAQKQMN